MKTYESDELMRLDREYSAITGDSFYLYCSRPGDGHKRFVFQDGVQLGLRNALEHMRAKLAEVQK